MGRGCHSAGVGPQEGRLWGDLGGCALGEALRGPGWRFTALSALRVSGQVGWVGVGVGFDLDLVWVWFGLGLGLGLIWIGFRFGLVCVCV